ncbi:vacuolar protein sorting-associated protein 35-domain-containing protein [Blastocladiella britannica]|nr:vacuolar protein sorting-associated protein 35-domain-containing protein [Blastocladiella britannica]
MSQSDLSSILAPAEDQPRVLADALHRVKAHAFHMKKSLDADRAMDAIKHALELANELRTGALTPKNYYELYMAAFDSLRYLASYLTDAHSSSSSSNATTSTAVPDGQQPQQQRANLAEIYELVQYSPTIVPRLYLMITVAAAYLPVGETPTPAILRDLIDMVRGVQHPVRGLFLRHYLSSMTKDYLPEAPGAAIVVPLAAVPSTVTGAAPTNLPEHPATTAAAAGASTTGAAEGTDTTAAAVVPIVEDSDPSADPPSPAMSSDAIDLDDPEAVAAAHAAHAAETAAAAAAPASDQQPGGSIVGPRTTSFHGTVDDSIGFVLSNFVEMNKLWVRLQHSGGARDRDRREAERRELRILVGTNVVRLSQLVAVTLPVYQTKILPPILDQVVHCHDPLAQEYLMEVIVQAFPDAFHLRTLGPVLAVTAQLQREVNIKVIIVALIDRLRNFASERAAHARERRDRAVARAAAANAAAANAAASNGATDAPTEPAAIVESDDEDDEEEDVIPEDLHLFNVFWTQITQVILARPDLGLPDISSLLLSLMQLSVTCYPDQLEYVDQILTFAKQQAANAAGTAAAANAATIANLSALLLAPLQPQAPAGGVSAGVAPTRPVMWLLGLASNAQAFRELLATQPYSTRLMIAQYLATYLTRQRGARVQSEPHLTALLECLSVLTRDQRDGPVWKNTGMLIDREQWGATPVFASRAGDDVAEKRREQLDELALEQATMAKFVALIWNDDTVVHAQLLNSLRKILAEGGGFRIKHTFPALVHQTILLVDRILLKYAGDSAAAATGDESAHTAQPSASAALAGFAPLRSPRDAELMVVFKLMHQLGTAIQHTADDVVLASHLYLASARAADRAGLEEIAYEFFVMALTAYEESINDSRMQFAVLTAVINALLECRVFGVDNYDTLATKCTLHAARLLKRADQCRAAIQCAHLFWHMLNTNYRDGKRVLECLQKAFKFADACLDSITNAELLIEILVRYVYFYEKGCPGVTIKPINSFLELIATNLSNLHEAARSSAPSGGNNNASTAYQNGGGEGSTLYRGFSASSLAGPDVGGGGGGAPLREGGAPAGSSSLGAVAGHFQRTCEMLTLRMRNPPCSLGEAGPFYNEITFPRTEF